MRKAGLNQPGLSHLLANINSLTLDVTPNFAGWIGTRMQIDVIEPGQHAVYFRLRQRLGSTGNWRCQAGKRNIYGTRSIGISGSVQVTAYQRGRGRDGVRNGITQHTCRCVEIARKRTRRRGRG